jgi:peptidoglycan/LPS O-acetylase OafA/YrhL
MKVLYSLRYVFAVMILIHHVFKYMPAGPCGVSFFFILSGFVMSLGYASKCNLSDFDFKMFIEKRLIRIYPLHLFCFILFYFSLLANGVFSFHGLLMGLPSVFLMQSWIPIPDVFFGANAVAWCLCDMLFFYILFPYLSSVFVCKKFFQSVFYLLFVLLVYVMCLYLIPTKYIHDVVYINPIFRLVDFIWGIFLYKVYLEMKRILHFHLSFWVSTSFEMFCIFLVVLSLLLYDEIPIMFQYSVMFWLPIGMLILSFALLSDRGGLCTHILGCALFVKLGKLSFSFYMLHYSFIILFNGVFSYYEVPNFIIGLSYIVSVSIVSYFVNVYYENPVGLYLKKRFKLN